MISLFLLVGCNLSYIVDLFAALRELASASARTLLKLASLVRALKASLRQIKTNITSGQEGKRKKKILTKNNDVYNTRIVTSNIKAIYSVRTRINVTHNDIYCRIRNLKPHPKVEGEQVCWLPCHSLYKELVLIITQLYSFFLMSICRSHGSGQWRRKWGWQGKSAQRSILIMATEQQVWKHHVAAPHTTWHIGHVWMRDTISFAFLFFVIIKYSS